MNLSLILKAEIPAVCASTTDLLNLESVLKELVPAGKDLKVYQEGHKMFPDSVYYNIGDIQSTLTDVYAECCKAECTLLIINPVTPNSIYFDVGVLPTPYSLLYDQLSEHMSENKFKEILPAVGGLTLKEVIELLMITECKHGFINAQVVMRSRLEYLKTTQGLDIVDTDIKGYVPEEKLHLYAYYQKEFFLGDYDYRLRPRGLVVHGVPGTGKTAGAKYLAQQWGVPLFRLDATVQSKWVGESEQNLTQALKQLEQHEPCILLIDEAEKLFSRGEDQGVTIKLLATILWWMQEHDKKVFTYMTCNDLEKLPTEIIRPGRVDKVIEIPLLNKKDATALQDIIADSFDEADAIQFEPRIQKECTGAQVFEDVKNAIKEKIKEEQDD